MTSPSGIARRGAAALLWNYAGNAARGLSQLGIGIILARLLAPADFGAAAIGWLVLGAGGVFAELGLSAAIIQRARIDDRDADFAFTVQIAAGLLIAAAIQVAAPWLARVLGQSGATAIVRATAVSLVLRMVGQMSGALLQRELRFRETQTVTVISYVAGYGVVGVALARLGFGAWSLVAAQTAQTGMSSLALLLLARRRVAFVLRPVHADIARTGLLVSAANVSSWGIANVDNMIVGHVAGPVMLGLYNRASALAMMPVTAIVGGLHGVVLSAASRVQEDEAKLRITFLGSVALFLLSGGSALATMALVSETVVTGLLGAAWRGAAPLLPPLAVAMLLHGMLAFAGPLLTATGQVRKEARVQWAMLPAMTAIVYLAARHSVAAAAWAVTASYAARLILLYRQVNDRVPLGGGAARRALLPPLACAIVTGALTKLADAAMAAIGPILRLATDIGVAAVVLAAAIVLLGRYLLHGPLGIVLRSSAIVPPRLAGMIAAQPSS